MGVRNTLARYVAFDNLAIETLALPGFPSAGTDNFLSVAVFEVEVLGGPTILTPLLLDFNTQIGRSDQLIEDDPAPETFGQISSALVPDPVAVKFPDGFGGVGRREVQTEILSLSLTGVGGFSVKAGQPALDFLSAIGRPDLFTPSLGEVESKDLTGAGAPATDFPADSFFDVFAVVETPLGPLFNKEPLLVVSRGILGFPPIAFYPHQSTTPFAVPLFSLADPDGPPVAFLKRSVHGTRTDEKIGIDRNDPGFEQAATDALLQELPPPLPLPPGYPPAGTDSFLSVAVFEVEVLGGPTILTPLLLDFNTQIGRSDQLIEDDPAPEIFGQISSALVPDPVAVRFPDGFGGVGRREVQTEILSLSLTGVGGFSVKAGQPALDFLSAIGRPDLFTPSLGEVESKDLTGAGAPATDFPADSFFDVFAVVETPLGPLFNKEPLLVVSRGILGFPPIAFYPHQSTTPFAVPLFSLADPDGPPVAFLKRSVHGTRTDEKIGIDRNDPGFEQAATNALLQALPPPLALPPGFPAGGTDAFLSVAVLEVEFLGGPTILTPLLLDSNTQISRSESLIKDDPAPETLKTISSALVPDPVVVRFPDGFGGVGRREVQTEILSLSLTGVGGFSVKADQPALDFLSAIGRPDLFTPSLGEVESKDLTGAGAPATDFPADSFFDVFAVIETPQGTLFNKEPLLAVGRGILGFPPIAFYPHQSTTPFAVPLFSLNDPDGLPVAFIIRAIQGTRTDEQIGIGVNDPGFEQAVTDGLVQALPPLLEPPNLPPIADAGPDQINNNALECTSPSGASVNLDGSGSFDSDNGPSPLSFTWTGPFPEGGGSVTGVNPTVTLSLGNHSIDLELSDGEVTDTDQVLVTVVDTTPPVLTVSADVSVECTAQGGQAVPIGSATATDICDPSPTVTNDAPELFILGMTTVTWTATDASGNSSTATQDITVVDTTPPALTVAAGVTVECSAQGGQAVPIGSATATDICDPSPTVTNDAPELFLLGMTTVTWTAIDASGNSSTATQDITVVDTTPPTLTLPADVTVECSAQGGQAVSIGTATATDICDPNPTVTIDAPATFSLGTTTVTWTAADASGNSSTGTQNVTVEDTIPPVITDVTLDPTVLWPPNHKYRTITVSVTAADICDPSVAISGTVVSDEPDEDQTGDGNTTGDIKVTSGDDAFLSSNEEPEVAFMAGDQVELRSERKGDGDGRVYTITVTSMDASGNSSSETAEVTVPHDQGDGKGKGKNAKLAKIGTGGRDGLGGDLDPLSGSSEVRFALDSNEPLTFGLNQNFPNPFNPETTIRYSVPEASEVRLTIYNIQGQQVRVLINAPHSAGRYNTRWDGRDAIGRVVSTGLYLYRLEAGSNVALRKMVFVK